MQTAAHVGLASAIVATSLTAGSAIAQQEPPSLDRPNRFAVTNAAAARRILDAARSRRIDFALIGDSNTRSAFVSGHEDGMTRAFSARFGMYATRVDPVSGVGGWGTAITGQSSAQNQFYFDGVEEPLARLMFSDPSFPSSYAALPAGESAQVTNNYGLGIARDHPLGINSALRYHFTDVTFGPGSGGYYNVSVRQQFPGSAYNVFAASPRVSTDGDAAGVVRDQFLDVPPGERGPNGILCALTNLLANADAQGPIMMLWHRVENPTRATGIGYSALLYQGGRSARAACASLLDSAGPAALDEWLRQLTRLQNDAPFAVVQILHGGNDVGDSAPSRGVDPHPSSTPEGHEDNLRCIIGELRAAWARHGYDPANLYFILGPYHPVPDRLDRLGEFGDRWAALATEDPNIVAVRGLRLSSVDEFATRRLYALYPIDVAHLSAAGYHAWGRGAVGALVAAAYPTDLDGDGAATVLDLFDYLSLWFSADPRADHDGDGLVKVVDIFAFLTDWFEG